MFLSEVSRVVLRNIGEGRVKEAFMQIMVIAGVEALEVGKVKEENRSILFF